MRQIHQVLTPAGLSPKNSMQWIYDTVLISPTFIKNIGKKLKQIQARNLRISIQKCSFIDNKATFCGRVLNVKGYNYDITYATKLLERVKPQYIYELAQFVYTVNFLCGIIPEFSRIRKLVLGDFKLVGKLKNLERKRLLIEWTSEMEVDFIELKEALKKALVSSLCYYNQNENIYIFADASDKYWSLYLCQTPDDVEIEIPLKARYRVIALYSGSFGGSHLN
eukprot:maker-scaffold_10-snap-gene-0.19-mRNA-1 protein AED:0.36 eAED:0.37 QI:0/0/0/1/1/1/2/0/222